MSESHTKQLSPSFHYIYKAWCTLVIHLQKGWECGFVGISKCKTGLPSPLFACRCFLTARKYRHWRHSCQKLAWQNIYIPLYIKKNHFFQRVLFHVLPDFCGNNDHIWLQTWVCGRESHLQIPDPEISWKINMDVKLTLPI